MLCWDDRTTGNMDPCEEKIPQKTFLNKRKRKPD